MAKYDADIGWLSSSRMVMCTCGHFEKGHRPMSRKCTYCDCATFHRKPDEKQPQQATHQDPPDITTN